MPENVNIGSSLQLVHAAAGKDQDAVIRSRGGNVAAESVRGFVVHHGTADEVLAIDDQRAAVADDGPMGSASLG